MNKLRNVTNLAKKVAPLFGIGTQAAAARLKNFTSTIGKWGELAGKVGYGLSVVTMVSKVISGDKISTSDTIGFGINTALVVAGSISAAPAIATAALVYGIVEFGSYIYNGKSIEQNILGE